MMKLVFILVLSLNLSGCIGIIPLAVYEYNYRNQLEANCQQGHQASCDELERKHKADRDYTPVADARH